MDKYEEIVKKFTNSSFIEKYQTFTEDVELLFIPVEGLCYSLRNKSPFTKSVFVDTEFIEAYLLKYLPENLGAFFDEVAYVYEFLLDFYQFLFEENYLYHRDYQRMLMFFQSNKDTFFKRMLDKSYWSKDKKVLFKDYEVFMSKLSNIEGGELEQLKKIDVLLDMLQEENTESKDRKVIPFPANDRNSKTSLQLRIDIKGFKPPIWRRVIVPAEMTFADLHDVIQIIFEWEDYHLYNFQNHDFIIQTPMEEDNWYLANDYGSVNPSALRIGDFFLNYKSINYTYDFGDDWEHKVKLEKIILNDELPDNLTPLNLPICIKGKGDAPAEDSRGEDIFVPFDLDRINEELSGTW